MIMAGTKVQDSDRETKGDKETRKAGSQGGGVSKERVQCSRVICTMIGEEMLICCAMILLATRAIIRGNLFNLLHVYQLFGTFIDYTF